MASAPSSARRRLRVTPTGSSAAAQLPSQLRVQTRQQRGVRDADMALTVDEQRRRGRHAGADARAEVALDPLGDRIRAAVGLEALEGEPQLAAALPPMRRGAGGPAGGQRERGLADT